MRNKRFIVLATLVCVALASAGIAEAVLRSGGVAADSATFDATTVARGIQKTCRVNGGDTYTYTRAVYKGASVSGDARLNGKLVAHVQSMVDDTTGVGALLGDFQVNTPGTDPVTPAAYGHIEGSLSGGQLSGSLRGHVSKPWGELFAGVNGGFTANGGFTNANLGGGAAADTGVVLSYGACVHMIYLH
jgi:hypothetical protein